MTNATSRTCRGTHTVIWMVALITLITVPSLSAFYYPVNDDTVLLPVWIEAPISGGNGSRWESELRVLNIGGGYVDPIVNLGPDCPSVDCSGFGSPMPPDVSVAAHTLRGRGPGGNPGALLFLRPDASVAFQLRVRDTSRDATRRGPWLPVVRRDEALATPMHLIGIPVDARYRYTFRIYSFTRTAGRANVRVFATSPDPLPGPDPVTGEEPTFPPDTLIADFMVNLEAGESAFPSYGSFDGLSTVVDPAVHREVRLVVEPEGGMPMWSMLSITNNETQEFTLIRPTKK
jgi:hypothetical protein